jgi:ABC-type phosphate/phosphonate transport system permease subunit
MMCASGENLMGGQVISELLRGFPLYKQSGWQESQHAGDDIPYLGLTIIFGIFVFLFESYIDTRQLKNFHTIKTLPKEIAGIVSEDTFKKSSLYGGDKLFFSRFEGMFTFVFALFLLLVGWFPYAWDLSTFYCNYTTSVLLKMEISALQNEMLTTIYFVLITTVVDTLFSLPFSLYSTFVIEERHGFNKSVFASQSLLSLDLSSDSGPLHSRQAPVVGVELCYRLPDSGLHDLGYPPRWTVLLFLRVDLLLRR